MQKSATDIFVKKSAKGFDKAQSNTNLHNILLY